jgi:hypothetical protein
MVSFRSLSIFAITISFQLPQLCHAQTPSGSDDAIRVTVSLNNDGSRTVYQFDNAKHEATATTTEPDGKPRGKMVYQTGEAGRFVSGVSFGPDGEFLFKALYKYDSAGRLDQETRLAKDDGVINKIVYKYDTKGKQIGFSVFDINGKLISGSSSPTPTLLPSKKRDNGC